MNDQALNEAIEDIKLIKQVLGKSADSLLSLGQIFLWWGVLFFSDSLFIKLFVFNNDQLHETIQKFPYFFTMKSAVLLIMGVLVYLFFSHKLPLLGKSKQIFRLWVFIISFNLVVPYLVASHDVQRSILIFEIRTPILLSTFALALCFTYILSGLKLTKWMSIIYMLAGFFAFLPGKVSPYFYLIVWPITFISLGIYFNYLNRLAREK